MRHGLKTSFSKITGAIPGGTESLHSSIIIVSHTKYLASTVAQRRSYWVGTKEKKVTVSAGDIIVIPAGVGHKNLGSENLGVVGAYPNGMPVDLMRAQPGERPRVDENIAAVPFPETDPFLGKAGLLNIWKRET